MIAGSYDDIQTGICYGGIAHAGPIRSQKAMWFSGNAYIDYSPTPLDSISEFTITLRCFPTSATQRFLSVRRPLISPRGGFDIHTSLTQQIGISSSSDSQQFSLLSSSLPMSTFYYVAVTHNKSNGNTEFFIDGISIGTGTFGICDNIVPLLTIGRVAVRTPQLPLIGSVNNIRIFSRILSSPEILAPEIVSDPVFYLPGSGITVADWTDTVGGRLPTINGTPELCYILNNIKIKKDGVIMNP